MAWRPHIQQARVGDSPVMVAAGSVWALLAGMGLLLLGNGLQYSLLGVRAANEGFSSTITGLVMSGYFVGFLAGSLATSRAVHRVGHLRVFAAAAALASMAILVQSLIVTPAVWGLMRIVTGFAYAAAYIVTESWLNDRVTNEHRGGLLGVYMIVSFLGMSGGQLLLNAGDPDSPELFILVSVLISFAAIPILLSVLPQPEIRQPAPVNPLELYRLAPLGLVACFATGLAHSALFGMGAVYGRSVDLTVPQVSLFMFVLVLGAAVLQWPIGKLSDRVDRRRVITWLALLGALACAITVSLGRLGPYWLIVMAVPLGVAMLPLYSLAIAHTNDHVDTERRVAASSLLTLVFGIGAVAGPSLAGVLMDLLGSDGFLWMLATILLALGLFAIVRTRRAPIVSVEEQAPYAPMPQRTASLSEAWVETVAESESSAGEAAARGDEPA